MCGQDAANRITHDDGAVACLAAILGLGFAGSRAHTRRVKAWFRTGCILRAAKCGIDLEPDAGLDIANVGRTDLLLRKMVPQRLERISLGAVNDLRILPVNGLIVGVCVIAQTLDIENAYAWLPIPAHSGNDGRQPIGKFLRALDVDACDVEAHEGWRWTGREIED